MGSAASCCEAKNSSNCQRSLEERPAPSGVNARTAQQPAGRFVQRVAAGHERALRTYRTDKGCVCTVSRSGGSVPRRLTLTRLSPRVGCGVAHWSDAPRPPGAGPPLAVAVAI
jgi:hypothetical protein